MAIRFTVPLQASPEQTRRLVELQAVFVQACNSLTPLARDTRCWNRVGLHHMVYRRLRDDFPQLGSQMACNAIYSVSRACRLVYQSRRSPWASPRQPERPLPLIMFDDSAPVYFDRHTLSLRDGTVSMFTLDGRLRFRVALSAEQEGHFLHDRLREVVLQQVGGSFHLCFLFTPADADDSPIAHSADLPEYLVVQSTDEAAANPAKATASQATGQFTGVA